MHYLDNLLLNTDSYKASHWLQYPPGTDATFFYVESRGGLHDRTVFFGLQAILKTRWHDRSPTPTSTTLLRYSPRTANRSTRPAGAISSTGLAATCRCASAPFPRAAWCPPTRH